jgi:hypothetical protein
MVNLMKEKMIKIIKTVWKLIKISLMLLGTFVVVLFLLHELGLTNVPGSITKTNKKSSEQLVKNEKEKLGTYPWLRSREWNVIRIGLINDEQVLNQVSKEVGLSPRIIAGAVIGEQTRFFTTDRAQFESYFEPVKKLINLSQFSYGIAGIKPDTALFVEQNINNPKSQFYLGEKYARMIEYPAGVNPSTERIRRLNDESHYYSYLYVALIQKMLIAQWERAGFDISKQPGVIATLYNIGFGASQPHAKPEIGGVTITLDGKEYSFGELADDFYYSGELENYFGY